MPKVMSYTLQDVTSTEVYQVAVQLSSAMNKAMASYVVKDAGGVVQKTGSLELQLPTLAVTEMQTWITTHLLAAINAQEGM